jgi:WD40 repeat protein
VAIHNVSDGGEASRFEGHEGAVRVVALHPNGKSLVTGGQDQTVRIWNTAWGWETWRVETGRRVTGLAFHPQGHLVMGFSDGKAELWEMQHG